MRALGGLAIVLAAVAGCGVRMSPDAELANDAGATIDAAVAMDARSGDASTPHDASTTSDGSVYDASTTHDASMNDASTTHDAAASDAYLAPDARAANDAWSSPHDASTSGGCISGAPGTMAVRFQWLGSGARSTAYVRYELNQLPDTSRWRVSAASTSFSYTPIYDDIFLGQGGLDLESPAFMDVELSTAGTSVSSATIAIYGRSFNTTASGSFGWQTFSGTGAAPTDLVSNVAPYQWYLADATNQLPGGNATTLLRIYPGPSSDALIVDRVEICFAP